VSTINGQPYVPGGASSVTPTGAIIAFAGQSSPTGWVICDGTSYDSTVPLYQSLYAVIAQNYGGTGTNFNVPDMRTRTIFGASLPSYGSNLGQFEAQGTGFQQMFVNYPGTTVPAGTAGSGRQAIAIYYIQPGFEIAVGMQFQAQTGIDLNIYNIVAILNYSGNSGTYVYPNFPILVLNTPMTADLSDNTRFNIKLANQGYTMGRYNSNNFITQSELQVAQHLHGNKQGGVLGNIGVDTNVPIGAPTNASIQTTQGTTNNRFYQIGPSTIAGAIIPFTIPIVMENAPSYLSMNYIIKL
jgi:microcystin-dependent protein